MGKKISAALSLLTTLFLAAASDSRADFVFTKIADHNTPIPGGTGNFNVRMSMPGIDGQNVVFWGFGQSVQQGLYAASAGGGPITRLADTSTPIPGGVGNFTSFSRAPSIHAGTVTFIGFGSGGQQGIYTVSVGGGPITRIADTSTPIPGGTGNFTSFGNGLPSPAISGGNIAFYGAGSGGQEGIYAASAGGPLRVVADKNTLDPSGAGTFRDFNSNPSIDGETVAFIGLNSSARTGVYTAPLGGEITTLADTMTPIPGFTGSFSSLDTPAIDGETVAFFANGSPTHRGIYTGTLGGGPISLVADTLTPIPSGSGNFVSFSPAALDEGHLAFLGFGSGSDRG